MGSCYICFSQRIFIAVNRQRCCQIMTNMHQAVGDAFIYVDNLNVRCDLGNLLVDVRILLTCKSDKYNSKGIKVV
jgi:hypothetical protein